MEQRKEEKWSSSAERRVCPIAICLIGIIGFFLPLFKSLSLFGKNISSMYFFEKFFSNDLAEADAVFFFCLVISFAFGVAILINCFTKQPNDFLNLSLSAISVALFVIVKKRVKNDSFGIIKFGMGWYVSLVAFSILVLYELIVILKYKREFLRELFSDADKMSDFAAGLSIAGLVCFLMPFATLPLVDDFAPGFIFLLLPLSQNPALFDGEVTSFFFWSVMAMLAGAIAMGKARKKTGSSLRASGISSFHGIFALLVLNGLSKKHIYLLATGFGWYGAFFAYFAAMICASYSSRLYKKGELEPEKQRRNERR